ncbi:Glycosyltransferase [Melia azedarach]|uniref:Glycosyltransferase n=1 Tax=Melia azedarach TaxID=155640 RepID=A0ACC1WU19_MELAZ|nr:Glycosyltransferase [Melia azedarach]
MQPHVAVLPSIGLGNVTPLFELAKQLVLQHGFYASVLVLNTNEASAAEDKLLRSPTLPPGLDVVDLPPVDVSAFASDDMPVLTRLCHIVEEGLKCLNSVLIQLGKPEALVMDIFCTQAFQFIDLPEPILIPGCSHVRAEALVDQIQNRKIDEYKWILLHTSRLPVAAGVFLNSWENIEPVPLKAIRENSSFLQFPTPPIYPVGPVIKEDELLSESDVEYLSWLDRQPSDSVLYVALGSGGTLTIEQLTEMPWKVSWTDSRKGAGVVVQSWAILRHPSTGGFLSHCGWNSSLESITHGMPMIAWPLYSEQIMNARLLTEEIGGGREASNGTWKKSDWKGGDREGSKVGNGE